MTKRIGCVMVEMVEIIDEAKHQPLARRVGVLQS